MSTRANIIIKDDYTTLIFYRHSDGYPSCTGEDLKEFVKGYAHHPAHSAAPMRPDAMQSAGWLIVRGAKAWDGQRSKGYEWKVGDYEPTARLHGDIEYLYVIDLQKRTLSCREPGEGFWKNASEKNTRACREFKTVSFADQEGVA